MFHLRILSAAFCLGLAALLPAPTAAAPLPEPTGRVILELAGAIAANNGNSAARFDLAMLDALPQRETVTRTPWYDGAQIFSGPLMADLINAVGGAGSALRVVAINDYAVEIPIADIATYPIILASRLGGQPMSVREKGPLFVIYPFDESPALNNEIYYSRSVWQVKRIEVLP
ncbi:MAG: hypothetical protein Q8K20_17400 [Gemmobacter sp.]|nr:hypothetical protein [Gemmobacter sp.]